MQANNFDFLSVGGAAVRVVSLVQPLFGLVTQREIEGVVLRDQTTRVAPMNLIFTQKYLDNRESRSHNVCVKSDKLGFFICLSAICLFFESYALFRDKNDNIKYTTVPSQPTQPKK